MPSLRANRWSRPRLRAAIAAGSLGVAVSLLLSLLLLANTAHAEQGLAAPALQAALASAVSVPNARVDVVALDRPASDCETTGARTRMETVRPIDGSGRFAVKLVGSRPGGAASPNSDNVCEVWAWARVRVFASVAVASRAIRVGEALASAVRMEEREIKPGHVPALVTDSSISDRSIIAGQMIEAGIVRTPGPRAGQPMKVLIVSGSLVVEQTGRAVSCGRDTTCAVLPSGKHVEGVFANGRLTVELP